MKYIVALVALLSFSSCQKEVENDIYMVPHVSSFQGGSGSFKFTDHTIISFDSEEQSQAANYLAGLFTESAGFTPMVRKSAKGDVSFLVNYDLKDEAYELSVTSKHIQIKASGQKGYFNAVQSLRMLLPGEIERDSVTAANWCVPSVSIADQPRFCYRGLMLDVARFFVPKDELMKIIDCMALLKLNTLHLHLTDDNGWRIEIKKYPLLTQVGSRRVDRGDCTFPNRRNPRKGEPTVPTGFYTQADIKEIVAYASLRQIQIIPEIDVPAHSNAALAAYPEYACPVVDKYIGVLPGLGGENSEIIYCAGNDKTFKFIEDILDEVMRLFPSDYIHLGGDEARKTYWKKCPLCQARIRKEKLSDEEALQGYFMNRLSKHVRSKGKKVMGWDELCNTQLPDNAIIFGWQGDGRLALKAAQRGHKFIMTPAKTLYLIRYQGPQWFEPLTYFGNNTLKDVYDYEPVKDDWEPAYENYLMGVQGSMWTEFCNKFDDVTYQIFPRLAALADVAWIGKGQKDWSIFLKGLDRFLAHLDQKGIVYAKSMYNIQHQSVPMKGAVQVNLESIRPDMQVRYTLDGSDPTQQAAVYSEPLFVDKSMVIKAAVFNEKKRMGEVLTLPVQWNLATGQTVAQANQQAVLLNGLRGSLRQSDFEWCAWLDDEFTIDIDLNKIQSFSKVVVGCLTDYGMGVHKPKKIVVEVSADNKHFIPKGEKVFTEKEIFKEGNFIEDLSFEFKRTDAQFIRVRVKGAGKCPASHVRPGFPSKVCFDEIMVD